MAGTFSPSLFNPLWKLQVCSWWMPLPPSLLSCFPGAALNVLALVSHEQKK